MEKIHSEQREVLMEVSPLIDFRGINKQPSKMVAPSQPLHTRNPSNSDRKKQTELSPIHDFSSKLRQPSVIDRLRDYVRWQAEWRTDYESGASIDDKLKSSPKWAPLSINLDVTTACNYRCDHCVDMDILNTGIKYDHQKLCDSLQTLIERGLKSVIIIGGGEPTAYPQFEEVVALLKKNDVKVGVVTNGSRLQKIEAVAHLLGPGDWVRLSLDSGDNETFRAMHKPVSQKVTLDWICKQVPPIKSINPDFQIGYSFIIVWKDCETNDYEIIENIDEMCAAAERAKQYQFDYISYKPFLTRSEENNAEVLDLTQQEDQLKQVIQKIRANLGEARKHEDDQFKVIESTNLRVLENGSYTDYVEQPHTCHMQFFRQVLSPLGVFNCPVYRNVPQALLGAKHDYRNIDSFNSTVENTLRLTEAFDATHECRNVTCLYNHANWFIEDLIQNPHKLDDLTESEERHDYFL